MSREQGHALDRQADGIHAELDELTGRLRSTAERLVTRLDALTAGLPSPTQVAIWEHVAGAAMVEAETAVSALERHSKGDR